MDKTIENKFFGLYEGTLLQCRLWLNNKYDLHIYPYPTKEELLKDRRWKEGIVDIFYRDINDRLEQWIDEAMKSFDWQILEANRSPLMEEIANNFKECLTPEEKERYLYSLLLPLKELSEMITPYENIENYKREIESYQERLRVLEKLPNDQILDSNGEPLVLVHAAEISNGLDFLSTLQMCMCTSHSMDKIYLFIDEQPYVIVEKSKAKNHEGMIFEVDVARKKYLGMIRTRLIQMEKAIDVSERYMAFLNDNMGRLCPMGSNIEHCFAFLSYWAEYYLIMLDTLLLQYHIDIFKYMKDCGIHILEERDVERVGNFLGSPELAKKYIQELPKEPIATPQPEGPEVPEVFKTGKGKILLEKAVEKGIVSCEGNKYIWKDTKQLLAYFAEKATSYLELKVKYKTTTRWKPFETLFDIKNLKGAKSDYLKYDPEFNPKGHEEIDVFFKSIN